MAEINWPLNPETGLRFTSDYGRTWIFDGCGWVFTCCESGPTGCGYADGITFWFPADIGWLTLFGEYSGMSGSYPTFDTPPSVGGSGGFVFFNEIGNQWEAIDIETGMTAAYGPELYGEWNLITDEGPTTAYVECGGTSLYCIYAFDDGPSGPISIYRNAANFYQNLYDEYPLGLDANSDDFPTLNIFWVGGPTGWVLQGESTYHPLGCVIGITGASTSIPVGTYTLCDDFEITISDGQCPT